MKQTLTFIPPVVDSTQSSIHTEAYEKVWNCNICFDMCSGNSKMKTKA